MTFVDVGAAASIDRPTLAGSTTKESILESSTGGVALFDYDNDGDVDIFIVNGPGPEMAADGGEPRAALYRNDGDWHFVEIGRAAGVDRAGWGMGAVAADYNGDGWVDLLVTAYGGNALYRNRGDGTFTDVAVATGAVGQGWSTGAVFADFDGDDDLDLYVAHYIDEPPDRASGAGRTCQWRGLAVFCGPAGLLASVDRYYRNEGAAAGWVFTQVDLPGNVEPGYGFGVLAGDFDGDGDSDIYVANDAGANALYRNDGKGFSETAVAAGVAYSGDGRKQAGMGIAGGDYDGDGDIDLFATNFSHDNNTLYRNDGQGLFHDASFAAGLGALSLGQLGWGTSFFDFDNDGDDDLFIANGHVYPQVDGAGLGTSYAQANQLFANLGNGRFTEISDRAGPGLQVQKSSRGMAAGDLDDDGDIDLVIVNIDDSPTVLRNDGGNGGNWLQVRLRQDGANTRAVGARVALQRGQRLQLRQVRAGTGYLSQGDMRLHFGLQDDAGVEELIVTWPDGVEDRFAGLGANQVVEIRRGQGVVVVSP
ncbi:MAG: hypothetical protein GKR89_35990 [Candidatus Latescibacteria bacterium]|nr:hypothetical protein [Candidatus Latescibacterota bacterium]